MFQKSSRYPKKLIPEALKDSRRIYSNSFSLILPKKGVGYAVIVSKKINKTAVGRNKIKRRAREILKTLTLPPAVLFFPKKEFLDYSFHDLRIECEEKLSKFSF